MSVVDVIQFEGSSTDLVWKSPIEDFNTATQLIVDETHEAIVMIEGRTGVLGPGRHTLETQNYFGLNAIQRLATGGKTAFPCKVYFVSKVHALDMKWGTPELLPVLDPELDIMLHLQLRGSANFVIDNSKKFMEKFTGFYNYGALRRDERDFGATRGDVRNLGAARRSDSGFDMTQVIGQLRGIIFTEVTDMVAKVFTRAKIGLFSVNAHLKDISELLTYPLGKVFEEYGIKLVRFNIETITSTNEDTAEFQAAKSAARAKVILAGSEAEARRLQGYTWSDEQKAAILKELAGNDGAAGSFMGGVLGIGASGPMSEPIGGIIDGFFGGGDQRRDIFSNGSGDGNFTASGSVPSDGLPDGGSLRRMDNDVSDLGRRIGFGLQEAPAGEDSVAPTTPLPQSAQPTTPSPSAAEQPTAMLCPQCGKTVDPTWKTCPFCAKPLAAPTCPNCGHNVDSAWLACPFCATKL